MSRYTYCSDGTEEVDEDIKKKKRRKVRNKGEQSRRLCFGQDANVEMLMKFAMSNVSHRGVCRVSSSPMLPLIRGADGIVARSMMGRTLPFGLAMQLLESVRVVRARSARISNLSLTSTRTTLSEVLEQLLTLNITSRIFEHQHSNTGTISLHIEIKHFRYRN